MASQSDQEGGSGSSGVPAALAAARRAVADEPLQALADTLFVSKRQPLPELVGEAQQQLADVQRRVGPIVARLRDGGAAHYLSVARYERYIALLEQQQQQQVGPGCSVPQGQVC